MLLSLRSRSCRNLLCISPLRSSSFYYYYYSTTVSANGAPIMETASGGGGNLMVDFLINSVGFSRDEAVSASSKVSHLKSVHNPQSIINLFRQVGGLDQTQIKDVVFSEPRILLHQAEKTLEPEIRALRDIGLPGSDLVRFIKRKCKCGLDKNTTTSISYLRGVLGSDDKLVRAIRRDTLLLMIDAYKVLPSNIALFRDFGFSNEQIEWLIVRQPFCCMRKLERIQDILHRVEWELGISRDAPNSFFYAFILLCGNRKTAIDKKLGVFRSFGWSDGDIFALVRTAPTLLSYSDAAILQKLEFYMQDLEYAPAYLASRNAFFTLSLEKRVKPRNEVLKILKQHKLIKSKQSLYSIIILTEEKFVKLFVLPYTDEVPNLYKTDTQNQNQRLKAE